MVTDHHTTLQRLVDELGESIARPVDLEDRELRVLAYSAHDHEIDAVRSRSILARTSPKEVDTWMRRHGIHAADRPLRLPAAPELGMAPRVCVPVRDGRGLLGFLWLVDEPGRVIGETEADAATRTAAACAPVLRAMRDGEDDARSRHRAQLQAALAGNDVAAKALIEDGAMVGDTTVAVLCAVTDGRTTLDPEIGGRARRLLPSRHALDLLVDAGELVLVVALPTARAAVDVASRLADLTGGPVGASQPRSSMADLPAALAEARAAALTAARIPGRGPAAGFESLGTDAVLATLDPGTLERIAATPILAQLRAGDADGTLRATALAWLDLGGDAAATAAALSLHRASVYQRLRRIETIADVSLRDGETRLALHLALRAERLLTPPPAHA